MKTSRRFILFLFFSLALILTVSGMIVFCTEMVRERTPTITTPAGVIVEPIPEPTPEATPETIVEAMPAQPPREVIDQMADPGCVRAIITFMRGLTATPAGALAYRKNDQIIARAFGSNELIFQRGRAQYTVSDGEEWLAFLEQLSGTVGAETSITYNDHGVDGVVDFGTGWAQWRHFGADRQPTIGLEHWVFWQESYKAAVDATVAQFNLKCAP